MRGREHKYTIKTLCHVETGNVHQRVKQKTDFEVGL
jgi:hypothetical protein